MNKQMILRQIRLPGVLLAGLLVFGATALSAQTQEPVTYTDGEGSTQQDPPSRVARLSYVDGSVSFQPGGQGEWGAATRNRPITVGDKIWVDNSSRAELQAGQASIHLSSVTALSFLNLDDQTTQMRLAEGAINFRVRELREGDVYEVDTPNVAFNVTQAGAFRIDVNENGDATSITAVRGEGQVTANGQTYTIRAGERGEFNGPENNVNYFVGGAPSPDEFDRWSDSRDLKEDNSISSRYVSRDVPGYSDLDDYGSWREEPDYGPVWYPSAVAVGWAPYSYGSWNYIGPWGWSWVDYEPWGFAPFHYGRWAFIGGGWGWCPGPYYGYPVYGPAFVGFLGGGFGFGASFGWGYGGGIGWFPLGPHEPFRPWYRTSGVYYRNVNINNTTIRNTTFINNRTSNVNYAYAHNVNAVTVSSRNNFVNGQPINRGAFHVTQASLRGAQVTNGANFAPNRQSSMGAAATRSHIATPSAAVQNRSVMARTTPAAAASHLPARTFSGSNNPSGQPARSGFNSANAGRPAMGRAAQTAAAANSNRPPSANGNAQAGARASASAQGNSAMSARQRELSLDKPQSHMRNAPSESGVNSAAQRGATNSGNTRNWSAQGNTTDSGRAPSGFGSNTSRNAAVTHPDRPSSAGGSGATGSSASRPGNSGYAVNPRSSADRPSSATNGGNARSYNPPPRSSGSHAGDRPSYNSGGGYSQPRYQSAPQRSYSPPSYSQPRSYSAPSRSYSAPSYSAPSRSYGGGGGSYHGGGGGSYGGGGGGYHGGGGGSYGGGGGFHGGGGGGSHGGGGGGHGGGSHGRG